MTTPAFQTPQTNLIGLSNAGFTQYGELHGVSASVDGGMMGFAAAEANGAELIALFVLSACCRQGIGSKLQQLLRCSLPVPEAGR